MKRVAYGAWSSPIAPEAIAAAGLKIGQVAWFDGDLCWEERRPSENGRTTIVRALSTGWHEDLLPPPYDVRSAVHEYGGGAFCAAAGCLWFVNGGDQAIYRRDRDGSIHSVTTPDDDCSYADLQIGSGANCLYAVCERAGDGTEPQASLVRIGADGGCTALQAGHDFYANPRLSLDGKTLAWLAWNHPDMPWDSTELWSADVDGDGRLGTAVRLAGGAEESLFGPVFAPNGRLYVASDRNGWWNIHRFEDNALVPVTHESAEFAVPQWVFGQSTFGFDDDGCLYALFTRDGFWSLAQVDLESGALSVFALPATELAQLRVASGRLALVAGNATTPMTLCTVATDGTGFERIQGPPALTSEAGALSTPETLKYSTAAGETAHALFYPPCNPGFVAPEGERPPLLIKCHGGPTGATSTALDPRIQFWTSRGFAVLDVNYRGSTGYGRAYRQALYGRWGVADVEDCVYGAGTLVQQGLVDAERVLISGSSAGGYTVLAVLAFANIAAAGASYYGIGDLARLMASTHKFESRYLRRLIGSDDALLRARSPLYHAHEVTCPVLFLQGGKDKVVPPDQATRMASALRERGIPVACVLFPEERHGFRDGINIARAIGSELAFYGRILGFSPAGTLPSLLIENDPI